MDWISVKDELPEDDTDVLVWRSGAGFYRDLGYYDHDINWWYTTAETAPITDVTHWMPLPEGPK